MNVGHDKTCQMVNVFSWLKVVLKVCHGDVKSRSQVSRKMG